MDVNLVLPYTFLNFPNSLKLAYIIFIIWKETNLSFKISVKFGSYFSALVFLLASYHLVNMTMVFVCPSHPPPLRKLWITVFKGLSLFIREKLYIHTQWGSWEPRVLILFCPFPSTFYPLRLPLLALYEKEKYRISELEGT